jgi:hypothetical protein
VSPENLLLALAVAFALLTGGAAMWQIRWLARGGVVRRRIGLGIASALVFAFLLAVLALCGELYFRFAYDQTDSFAFSRSSLRWFERHYYLNRSAFRDDVEYVPLRTAGKPRVSFLGDSFTEGQGIREVEDRFVNRIRAARPDWEIQALCRAGLETEGEIELLKRVLDAGFQLDRVVLIYCLNDISDLVPSWGASMQQLAQRRRERGWLVRHSYLADALDLRLLLQRDPGLSDYFGNLRGAYAGATWTAQQARLRELTQMVQANGGTLLVVVFPFIHALGKDYAFADAHRALADFWSSQGIPMLDLLPVFDGQPPDALRVNARDAHPNERANELAAQAILPFLDTHVHAGELPR